MTREEAITVLERLSDNPLLGYQHKVAFNIAIHDIKQRHDWDINNLILINKDNYESLEQQPCYNPDEWCHDCSEYNHDKHCCPRYNKVIRNTVEEMKQPCEDVISRAQAQTEIEMHACRYTLAKERDCMGQVEWSDQLIKVSDTVDIIRNLPSVKPLEQQPKVGHWIYERCDMYSCSVCHHWHTDLDEKMNYCPNCGAKMVEPQESEEI